MRGHSDSRLKLSSKVGEAAPLIKPVVIAGQSVTFGLYLFGRFSCLGLFDVFAVQPHMPFGFQNVNVIIFLAE